MSEQHNELNKELPDQLRKPEYNFIKLGKAPQSDDPSKEEIKQAKRPVKGVSWKDPSHQEPFNSAKLTTWLNHGHNVGLLVQHNLLILDFDSTEAYDALEPHLPDTFTVESQSRNGYHVYYRCYDDLTRQRSINTPDGDIDTRIPNKGYIIIPPSKARNTYRVHCDEDIATIDIDNLDTALGLAYDEDVQQNLDNSAVQSEPHSEQHSEPVEDDEITEVLDHISTDERPSYHKWFKVIAAVYDATHGDKDKAEAYLKNWRAEETKGEYRRRLRSLDGGHENPTTWATAIHYAKQDGDYNPSPDYDTYKGFRVGKDRLDLPFSPKTVFKEHATRDYSNGSFTHNWHWEIHELQLHAGHPPIYVRSKKQRRRQESLVVKPYDHDSYKYLRKVLQKLARKELANICDKWGVAYSEDDDKQALRDKIIAKHDDKAIFFYCSTPIQRHEFKRFDNHLELVKDVLSEGATQIDERLLTAWCAQVVRLSLNNAQPGSVQSSNSHTLMVTNPGTGKSTRAELILGDLVSEGATDAGLLGFATSDRREHGQLHRREKPTFIDELSDSNKVNLKHLRTYMEQGGSKIPKGIGLKCEGVSSLVFQGNPEYDADDDIEDLTEKQLLVQDLTDILDSITDKKKAMSRRIGLFYFGRDYKELEGAEPEDKIKNVISQILESLAENFKDEYTDLLTTKAVNKWINNPHSHNYKEIIDEIKSQGLPKAAEKFLEGQKINHSHVRGTALKLAWLDTGVNQVLEHDDVDTQSVLDKAKEYYEQLKEINLEAYKNLRDVSDEAVSKVRQKDLERLSTKHEKIIVHSVLYHVQSGIDNHIVAFEELSDTIDEVRQELGIKENYKYVSRLKQKISDKAKQTFEKFGFRYQEEEGYFFLVSPTKLQNYADAQRRFTHFTLYPPQTRSGRGKNQGESTDQSTSTTKKRTDEKGKTGKEGKTGKTGKTGKVELEEINTDLSDELLPATKDNIGRVVDDLDDGEGAPIEYVLEKFDDEDKTEQIIQDLKTKGDIFKSKPGRVKKQ